METAGMADRYCPSKRELFQLKCRKKELPATNGLHGFFSCKAQGCFEMCRRKISLKAETNL